MNNARFAISLHILTLLDLTEEELLSSQYIASSININPVTVRKEIGNLRKYGMVESVEGKNGGSYLAKPAGSILLSEVYYSVRQTPLLGRNKNDPDPSCIVGSQINQHLDELYDDVEQYLESKLSKITLAQFSKQFR